MSIIYHFNNNKKKCSKLLWKIRTRRDYIYFLFGRGGHLNIVCLILTDVH